MKKNWWEELTYYVAKPFLYVQGCWDAFQGKPWEDKVK